LAMRQCIESQMPQPLAREDEIRRHAAGFSWDGAAAAYLALYRRSLKIS